MKRLLLSLVLALSLGFVPPVRAEGEPVKIAPHRAVYKMSLSRVKNGSSIHEASGTMLFDWSDACDGWAIQQRMKLHFVYSEGDEADVDSAVVTWESKDGKNYNFNVRRQTNGKEEESYKGRASMGEQGGVARYTIPKDKKDVALTADTIFPSAHTVMILKKALAGEKLFSKPVFDGSDEAGLAYVSVFIGAKIDKPQETEMNPELKKSPLLNAAAWPVRLAFYKPDEQTSEPDYEMDLTLQSNGIARAMTIDYGDFSVSGVLTTLEPAPEIGCAADGK